MATKINKKPSQDFIPIKEIRDGAMVLKDNSIRMILMTSSLNFALKSAEEQEAIVLQYQNFLNSLDFHVQFFIQSKGLNIETYLDTLRKREQEQTDELLKIQTKEYIEFVKEFVSSTKIVSKNFYVVIPYTPAFLHTEKNPFSEILGKLFKKRDKKDIAPKEEFEKQKIQLQQRVDTVIQGLSRVGVRSVPLNTEELIELFHGLYNPSERDKTSIPKIDPSPSEVK
ncbi:TraC family protein [Patescibacteria group bacterium]